MGEIVETVAAIQIEQASAKVLLAENTETIKEIKTDTAAGNSNTQSQLEWRAVGIA